MTDASARDRILAAALAEFGEAGFERATVTAIRRRADVSNGSFFHHFADKEAVAEALYLEALAGYHGLVLSAVEAESDPAAGLTALVRTHLAWVEGHPALARFLFARGTPDWTAERSQTIGQANRAMLTRFSAWAKPHIAAGRLVDWPTPLIVAQLIGPAQIVARAWASGTAPISPADAVGPLARAACAALIRTPTP
jgi:AcrR family transcriptional regulator